LEKETKLFRYLQSCTGYELRRIRVMLESPFFNLRPELLRAWDCIRPFFPKSELPLPGNETVFAAAYPNKAFDIAKFRHLQSDLCKQIEEFWQMQQLRQQHDLQQQLLLQAQSDRGLHQDFEGGLMAAQTELLSQPLRGAAFLRQRLDLALLQHDHQVRHNNRSTQAGLQAALEALDEEFFTHKLRLAAAAINRANVIGETTEINLLPEVIALIDNAPKVVFEGSLLEVYRLILRTLQPEKDHVAFQALLQLLEDTQQKFDGTTLAELYSFALNYCVRMVNLAESGFDAQLFGLYELLIARGYLREDGHLPVQHFKNFVTLGLRLAQIQRVSAGLVALAEQLVPEIRPNALLFSQAAIAFHSGNYGKAIRLLQQVEFLDVYYHLDAKSLLLKAWYEQGEVEPLLSLIESFKVYLRRSRKISEYQRQTYRNQIRVVQMLLRHRLGSRKPLQDVRQVLEGLRPIADLSWLERKLIELEQ
jgi:hypothetical protein